MYGSVTMVAGKNERLRNLSVAAKRLIRACEMGELGQQYHVVVDKLSGPRVGALYISTSVADANKLFSALTKGDCSAARQLFPWQFDNIEAYWDGNKIRIDANWPPSLAITDVRFSDIKPHPKHRPGVFFPGVNEYGSVVAVTLDDQCPHVLLGGASGMGKSVAMQNIIPQLAAPYLDKAGPRAKIILIDGKNGRGLRPAAHVAGQIGPMATNIQEIHAALAWLSQEMRARQAAMPGDYRKIKAWEDSLIPIFVIVDEVQQIVEDNAELASLLRSLSALARDVKIHIIMSTQKPLQKVFGDNATKANLTGRMALRTVNDTDSRLIVGGPFPRAEMLQPWEAWVIAPPDKHRRTQLFNVTAKELSEIPTGLPEMDSWPAIDMADALGQFAGPIKVNISPMVAILSICGARCDPPKGQGALQEAWETAGEPEKNSTKARAKRDWGREALAVLRSMGMDLCPKRD